MPSINPPQNRGGRLRKHATTATAAEAKKESNRRQYQQSRRPPGPANFIAYKLVLCADVPTETRAEIGLQTSPDIPIPQDVEI